MPGSDGGTESQQLNIQSTILTSQGTSAVEFFLRVLLGTAEELGYPGKSGQTEGLCGLEHQADQQS